jgi:1-aminocyclopropane-1-carboxylate deaminase/D-cysteine desulfhydrase-like pyridoxal-dependent ACC family enzyme
MFDALASLPSVPLAAFPTPVEELPRLRAALGGGPRLLIKRDDAIGFAFGGNKVRKMQLVAADAQRRGADTLITSGGVQSNHARVTAATAARLGMRCVIVANGAPPEKPTANALLDHLLGAEIRYVGSREERSPTVEAAARELRSAGHVPYVVPIGASTPLGAAAYALAVQEMLEQIDPPDVIVHSTSSGGTQAGLTVGCALAGVETRVIGISADESGEDLSRVILPIMEGLAELAGEAEVWQEMGLGAMATDIDDRFVGDGYGLSTDESREAIELTARTEAIFLDPTYTAKAMAGMIARVRNGEFRSTDTVLFWHTGGQVVLFA